MPNGNNVTRTTRSNKKKAPQAKSQNELHFTQHPKIENNYEFLVHQFMEFIGSQLCDCSRVFNGDLTEMVVLTVIGQIFFRHLTNEAVKNYDLGGEELSVSISRISELTAIPRETVRRKLLKMKRKGWVEQDKKTKQNILLFYVKGKTSGRELVARHNCVTYLKRIHSRTEAIKHLTFLELLKAKRDEPVFVLPNGTQTENLRGTFRNFLKEYNLLKDPRTNQNRTLYSLRHSYATFMLSSNKGTDIHLLAKQMGTSTQMIEKHYSHLIARMRSVDLAGKEHGVYEGLM